MRTLHALLVLVLSTTAYAQPRNQDLPQNRQPQTEERYQPRNQLADVRLDPTRERVFIALPRTGRPLDYLELRAGRARLTLLDVEVRFADGTSIHTGDRGLVESFEGRVIDLPRGAAPVIGIVATYRASSVRYPPRLQVFGVPQHYYRYGR